VKYVKNCCCRILLIRHLIFFSNLIGCLESILQQDWSKNDAITVRVEPFETLRLAGNSNCGNHQASVSKTRAAI
jgi:hypothetical protein